MKNQHLAANTVIHNAIIIAQFLNPGGKTPNSLPLTVTTQSKAFRNPEAWNWNFTVERELPVNTTVSVGYVGRLGLHLQREADINQPTLATVLANPGINLDALRPYKGYNSIRESDNVGRSIYNSLQLTANKRFSHGLLFGVAYTLGQAMDSGSHQRDIVPNTYDAGNMWGQSFFDVRHIMTINYLYELPFFRNEKSFLGKALGGWQISGITQFQTGTTCSVLANNDYAGVGVDGNLNDCGGAGQFWVMSRTPDILHQFAAGGANDAAQWFSVTNTDGSKIFSQPAKGTFNQQPGIRNPLHNPGFQNWNLGLYKKFAITERTGFQFRAQAFDAFNHPNWSGADFNPTSATFGKVTGKTNDVRNLQLSLRYYF
jgi:hypothetical protein